MPDYSLYLVLRLNSSEHRDKNATKVEIKHEKSKSFGVIFSYFDRRKTTAGSGSRVA